MQLRQPRFGLNQLGQILVGVFPKLQQLFVILDGQLLVALFFINPAHEIKAFGVEEGVNKVLKVVKRLLYLQQRSKRRLILSHFKLAFRQGIKRPGSHLLRQSRQQALRNGLCFRPLVLMAMNEQAQKLRIVFFLHDQTFRRRIIAAIDIQHSDFCPIWNIRRIAQRLLQFHPRLGEIIPSPYVIECLVHLNVGHIGRVFGLPIHRDEFIKQLEPLTIFSTIRIGEEQQGPKAEVVGIAFFCFEQILFDIVLIVLADKTQTREIQYD